MPGKSLRTLTCLAGILAMIGVSAAATTRGTAVHKAMAAAPPASVSPSIGPAAPVVSSGRWDDTFDDAAGLEDRTQTRVGAGAVTLDGDVQQAWQISSQVGFQTGNLNQVDSQTQPGALILAQAPLQFAANTQAGDVLY